MIEVEPDVKRRLYSALALSGSTLKKWFVKAAADYCEETAQPSLFKSAPKQGIRLGQKKASRRVAKRK